MPLPAAAVGGLAAAAASVVGTGANMIQTGKLNKKGRAFTKEQNELNRQQTWDMWNATNDFNLMTSDPSFQMQRWKDAGLNPHLMYGNPQDVKASNMNTQQFQNPELKGTDFRAPLQDFLTQVMQKKQIENMDAQISKTKAEEQNVITGTANSQFDLNAKEKMFPTVQGTAEAELTNKIKTNEKMVQEIAAIGSQIGVNNQQIKNMQAQVGKTLVEIKTLQGQQKLQEAETEAKNLANKLFRATMQSEADAKNAENQMLKETGGVGRASIMQMPAIIVGKALDIIQNTVSPKQLPKLKEAVKRDLKFKD